MIKSLEFSFSPHALEFWVEFQKQNRREMENAGFLNESHISRLNGQPDHVLKLATIFELSLWLENSGEPPKTISLLALETAVLHTEHCLRAGQALDQIANRAQFKQTPIYAGENSDGFLQFKEKWRDHPRESTQAGAPPRR